MTWRALGRCITRSIGFVVNLAVGFAIYAVKVAPVDERNKRRARAQWLQLVCQRHLRLLNIHTQTSGPLPSHGLIVANHVSYLDIVVLSAVVPCVFVSKKEVGNWPIFGTFAQLSGSIFVDRERRGHIGTVAKAIEEVLGQEICVSLFAEGTTSDGSAVKPFKPSLFEPVTALDCPVTPAALSYHLHNGSVRDEIHWWGSMTLLPHMLNVFCKDRIDARIRFGDARRRTGDRKLIARELQAEVADLYRSAF